jgi:hypothetical protein
MGIFTRIINNIHITNSKNINLNTGMQARVEQPKRIEAIDPPYYDCMYATMGQPYPIQLLENNNKKKKELTI